MSKSFLTMLIIVVAAASLLDSSFETSVAQTSLEPTHTTLEEIVSGRFPTATDKHGTGGVLVRVDNLTVLAVVNSPDGDWVVLVTDGKRPIFITEIIPRDQGRLKQPTVNQAITEVGTPYCDKPNANQAWHGSTCWEIHPVTDWALFEPIPEIPIGHVHTVLSAVILLCCLSVKLRRSPSRAVIRN